MSGYEDGGVAVQHGTYETVTETVESPGHIHTYTRLRWRHFELWWENGQRMGRWIWEYRPCEQPVIKP